MNNKQIKRYVLLDDDLHRTPQNIYNYTNCEVYLKYRWTIVRNYDEFIADTIANGVADCYSFDHDLHDSHYKQQDNPKYDQAEKTGWHCAKWLIDYCLDKNVDLPEEIYIHSMNIVGAMNIKSLFTSYYKVYPTDSNFYINDVFINDGYYVYSYQKGGGSWDSSDNKYWYAN
jgi:hypothetical protein